MKASERKRVTEKNCGIVLDISLLLYLDVFVFWKKLDTFSIGSDLVHFRLLLVSSRGLSYHF